MLQQYSGSIGTAAMSVIIAIAGSPYQGQSKQVVMGSQAAFIVLFVFTLLIFACVLSLIKRDKQGLVKNKACEKPCSTRGARLFQINYLLC